MSDLKKNSLVRDLVLLKRVWVDQQVQSRDSLQANMEKELNCPLRHQIIVQLDAPKKPKPL